jgi:hypothetical protein
LVSPGEAGSADVFFLLLLPVIFGLIILFGAVEVALSTWLVNWYDNRSYPSHSYRDRIRFTCFVSWWTLVFAIAYLVFYQIAATSIISSVASHAGWLFLTWIFWTAAAASVTAMLGGGLDCGRDYVNCSQLNALEGASSSFSAAGLSRSPGADLDGSLLLYSLRVDPLDPVHGRDRLGHRPRLPLLPPGRQVLGLARLKRHLSSDASFSRSRRRRSFDSKDVVDTFTPIRGRHRLSARAALVPVTLRTYPLSSRSSKPTVSAPLAPPPAALLFSYASILKVVINH